MWLRVSEFVCLKGMQYTLYFSLNGTGSSQQLKTVLLFFANKRLSSSKVTVKLNLFCTKSKGLAK